MLRDLQDAASAAEWHETVARIFRYLFWCAAVKREVADPRLIVWQHRIEAAIAAGPAALKIWYEAPTFSRADPNIALVASALGLTAAQVDTLFIEAAKL
jgi:hypothetical protein